MTSPLDSYWAFSRELQDFARRQDELMGPALGVMRDMEKALEPMREMNRSYGNELVEKLTGGAGTQFLQPTVRDLLYSGQSISSLIGTAASLSGALIQPDAARSAFVPSTLGGIAALPHETWQSLIGLPRIEALALTHLEVTKLDRLAEFFAPLETARGELRASLEGLTGSFANLTKVLPRVEVGGQPPSVLARRSAADVLFASHLAAAVSTDESAVVAVELAEEVRDVAADGGEVRELLGRLDPDLVVLLDGADEARKSSNPDRVRHTSASLRELIRDVMHRLAPDEEIRAWSSDPIHFDNNRPPRRARLLFVARAINKPPLDEFVAADVASMLRFLGLFQEGTHAVRPAITDEQLHALQIRAEGLLRFLLILGTNHQERE